MKESYQVLKKAIEKIGVKQAAAQLAVSGALVYKWCQSPVQAISYKEASGAMNPLDRIKKIYEVTRDPEVINWICQMADGYFVENPPVGKLNYETKMLANIQNIIKEFSETLDAISQSYHNDKKISEKEARMIRNEWEDLKKIAEGFVMACELGKFRRKGEV